MDSRGSMTQVVLESGGFAWLGSTRTSPLLTERSPNGFSHTPWPFLSHGPRTKLLEPGALNFVSPLNSVIKRA